VTTSNSNGCTNATASGTITVVPRYAACTNTWVYGSQTWSCPINVTACNKANFTSSNTTADCRSYTTAGKTHYLYNWPYVNSNASTLCPSPWRVPTSTDFSTLKANTTPSALTNAWGVNGDFEQGYLQRPDWGWLWSATTAGSYRWHLRYNTNNIDVSSIGWASSGLAVRCVK
jgi:hypothetical protein